MFLLRLDTCLVVLATKQCDDAARSPPVAQESDTGLSLFLPWVDIEKPPDPFRSGLLAASPASPPWPRRLHLESHQWSAGARAYTAKTPRALHTRDFTPPDSGFWSQACRLLHRVAVLIARGIGVLNV